MGSDFLNCGAKVSLFSVMAKCFACFFSVMVLLRPDRNIQNNTLTGAERKQVKENLTKFCNIIYKQMKEKYDANDYWQSEICQNYSRKCLVQQTCCDKCTNFIRIKPQYCNRCGATVMSRNKVTICDRCKLQRKKQYQKKYMALKKIKKN